jgi:YD repeat-containing protein
MRCIAAAALVIASVVSAGQSHATSAVVISYSYDDLDRLTRVERADGPMLEYIYDEVTNMTLRTISNSGDYDGDQLANFADPDDDNDLIPDSIEVQSNLNPYDAEDAAMDADGDGISNLQEYLLGSNINRMQGDLNDDAIVDIGDLILLSAILFNAQTATLDQQLPGHGDVNLNGRLDVGDLIILRRIYEGP